MHFTAHTAHCNMHISQCTLQFTALCTLQYAHFTHCTLHCSMLTALCNAHCNMHIAQFTWCTVKCVHCTAKQYALHCNMHFTAHYAHCNMHSTVCTVSLQQKKTVCKLCRQHTVYCTTTAWGSWQAEKGGWADEKKLPGKQAKLVTPSKNSKDDKKLPCKQAPEKETNNLVLNEDVSERGLGML